MPLIAAVFVLAIIIGLVASRPDLASGQRSAETLAAGKNFYAAHCASCHWASLEGQANWRRA
ncbi:MAG: cytochrome c, partial [Proteobacteria bacterium]|nr:cytochrome c [Pseudomonadota bacterium]